MLENTFENVLQKTGEQVSKNWASSCEKDRPSRLISCHIGRKCLPKKQTLFLLHKVNKPTSLLEYREFFVERIYFLSQQVFEKLLKPLFKMMLFFVLNMGALQAGQSSLVPLKWGKVEGAVAYRLEISKTKDFKKIIFKIKTKKNSYLWQLSELGSYYWHVCAMDQDQQCGQYSASGQLNISVSAPLPLAPKSGLQEELSKPIVFKWKSHDSVKTFELQIAQDKKFKKVTSYKTTKSHKTLMLSSQGQ